MTPQLGALLTPGLTQLPGTVKRGVTDTQIQRARETQNYPDTLYLVRHGESAGNVARDAAEAAGLGVIDIAGRDVDVPLSPLGERQSHALGAWLGGLPDAEKPTVILTSPYLRAQKTAQIALATANLTLTPHVDERLREKEFGLWDRLTRAGVVAKFPEQAEMRRLLGKFYHRPPGGESWCDVILRLRSVIDTLSRDFPGERVFIVAHQVVVLCFRYLFERMTEDEILAVDAQADVANCGVTEYGYDAAAGKNGLLTLRRYNFVAPLEAAGEPITTQPDVPVAVK